MRVAERRAFAYERFGSVSGAKERIGACCFEPLAIEVEAADESGSGGNRSQGGTTAQKKAAGRKGGNAAARKS